MREKGRDRNRLGTDPGPGRKSKILARTGTEIEFSPGQIRDRDTRPVPFPFTVSGCEIGTEFILTENGIPRKTECFAHPWLIPIYFILKFTIQAP